MQTKIDQIREILIDHSTHADDDGYITDACLQSYLADANNQASEGNGWRFEIGARNTKSGNTETYTLETVEVKNRENLTGEPLPLYHQYPAQCNPQDAYVEIDPTAGTITADCNGEIGNAVPANIWHGLDIRVPVCNAVNGDELLQYLQSDDAQLLLIRVINGHTVSWNGSNHVGSLDDDAQSAREELEAALSNLECAEVWDAEDYFAQSAPDITAETTDDEIDGLIERYQSDVSREGQYINGLEKYLVKYRDELPAEE